MRRLGRRRRPAERQELVLRRVLLVLELSGSRRLGRQLLQDLGRVCLGRYSLLVLELPHLLRVLVLLVLRRVLLVLELLHQGAGA